MPNLPREKNFSFAASLSSAAKVVDFRSKVVEKRLSHGFFRDTLLLGA